MPEHENSTRCRLAFDALWQRTDLEPMLALPADDVAYYHFELDDEALISRVRTVDRDRENIEAFWAAVGPVPS
jgi:hypothetical protein